MKLNSACLDVMVRGLLDVKMGNAYPLNAFKTTVKFERGSVMVWEIIYSASIWPLFVFTVILMPEFI